jgi:hypothetical protein
MKKFFTWVRNLLNREPEILRSSIRGPADNRKATFERVKRSDLTSQELKMLEEAERILRTEHY